MADNTPRDDHAKALKQATSMAKQLRTRVMSDPEKADELVDQLNESTGLRLVAHRWAEAVAEAQEAVAAADKLVASRGPVGPYTPMPDAARYFTALGHVARLQAGMGLPGAGEQTAEVAYGWADQLTQPNLASHLSARTAVLTLMSVAAGRLAGGDLCAANAHADAAVLRAREARLGDDPMTIAVLVDALALQADCRWAANLPEDALAANREALELWHTWTAADLQQLPRMTKGHLDRVAAPAYALQRDLADRTAATGDVESALALREQLAELLHKMAARRSEQGRVDLALARADQASGLLAAGRSDEAARVAEAALEALQKLYKAESPVGQYLPVQALVAPVLARAELAQGRVEAARRSIEGVFSRMAAHRCVEVPVAAQARAQLVRHEVLQAAGDSGADAALAEFDRLAAQVREMAPGDAEARDLVEARARGVVLRGTAQPPHWENLPDERALAGSTREVAAATTQAVASQLSDEEMLRRIDEQREAEARERAVAELRAATERAERERQQAAERAERLAAVEARQAAEREAAEQAAEQERARQEAAQLAAEQAEREAHEQREREAAELEAAQRQQQEAEAARLAAEQEQTEHEREAGEAEAREAAEREAAAAAEAHRVAEEAQRSAEQAERAEAERLAAERREQEEARAREEARQRAEQEEAEAARAEAQAAADRERAAAEARAAIPTPDPTPVDPLERLRADVRQAVGKDAQATALERLAAALEARAGQEAQLRGETVRVLEQLADVQGWWGGRGTSRHAKQLAREWGL